MKFFDPGRLNRLVSIRAQISTADAIGQPLDTWVEVAQAWADIRHPRGLQALLADKPTSEVQASIRIRYRWDITAGMRIHHGTSVYHIDAVLPDEGRRQWVDFACTLVS